MSESSSIDAELQRLNQMIGVRLRITRKLRGLTQTQLGEMLGVTFRQVQKYENGTNRLSAASLGHLCAALDCYPIEILNGGEMNDREVLNLALANGFEDVMIRIARLGEAQRASVKHALVSLLDDMTAAEVRASR